MNWESLALGITQALVWPIVVIIVAVVFMIRFPGPIAALMERISEATLGRMGVKFEKKAQEVEVVSDSMVASANLEVTAELTASAEVIAPAEVTKIEDATEDNPQRDRLTSVEQILHAWGRVERAASVTARELGFREKLPKGYSRAQNVELVVRELERRHLIQRGAVDFVRDLRAALNRLRHNEDFVLTAAAADSLLHAISNLQLMLYQIGRQRSHPPKSNRRVKSDRS